MEALSSSRTAPSILIVEDDRVICEMLGKVIQRKFLDVTMYLAENGRVGVDLFKEHTPEIVITDINMPVMDGIEMAAEIKSMKVDARFIVMTAYSDKVYFEKFSEIGFCEYLLKPIVLSTLFAAIEKCITEIRTERQ
ncbi:MAG TPA: response regulator [Desulfuromonadaceae bacterium]